MSSTPASRQTFFSEDNLFLLLNVIHESVGDVTKFDKTKSQDRQQLFQSMTSVYQEQGHDQPLNKINKVVLRQVFLAVQQQQQCHQQPTVSPPPPPHAHDQSITASTAAGIGTGALSGSGAPNAIRDAEINQRPMPVQFEERPQQAFVRKQQQSPQQSAMSGEQGGSDQHHSLDAAMQALQNDRNTDTVRAPQEIDFAATALPNPDNSDIMSRLQDAEAARDADVGAAHTQQQQQPSSQKSNDERTHNTGHTTGHPPLHSSDTKGTARPIPNPNVHLSAGDEQASEEGHEQVSMAPASTAGTALSDAISAFEHQNQTMDSTVLAAEAEHQNGRAQLEAAFQSRTAYDPSATPEIVGHTAVHGKSIDSRVSRMPAAFGDHGHSLLLSGGGGVGVGVGTPGQEEHHTPPLGRLEANVQVTRDVEDNRIDEREFQKALHLETEERELEHRLAQSTAGVQEELLIKPRSQFTNTVHNLEVCSNDRVRTLPTGENGDTPYSFTLYFNSNRPSYRVYPIYDNHPIEDAEDYTPGDDDCKIQLDTMNVRRCSGMRGYPKADGMPPCSGGLGPLSFNTSVITHYETVQQGDVAGPNVDTVFYNVQALQTNHVQIYFPYDHAPKYPYIVLEIEQFGNVYKSSNSLVRKSFCKLFYDRSSTPTLQSSQYHMYTPLNQERKTFVTPLASIDRLTFKLYNSFGNPLDQIQDVQHVKAIYLELNGATDSHVHIVLREFVAETTVTAQNHIGFEKCIEWYNQTWYSDWFSAVGCTQLADQQQVEEDYYDKLSAHKGADQETLQKLKQEFTRKQIQFDFPSVGYPADGHFASLRSFLQRDEGHVVQSAGTYDSGTGTCATSTTGYINCVTLAIPTDIDRSTGAVTAHEFGGSNASLQTKLHSPDYQLMTCTMLNDSVCTNISMTVITRDEDSSNVVVSRNV